MPRVSICIPTYKRPGLLKVAVDSCLGQTFRDFEIVISDDSPDFHTEEMVRSISSAHAIRYVHNRPGLGQAKNVNQLFNLANAEFLVLLHDDDFLMPGALSDLLASLQENPSVVASFGKQYLASHDGNILELESKIANERYCKTDDRANTIQRSDWSVLAMQFPPDGYMVRAKAARDTLYRDDPDIGEACDGDFSIRLSQLGNFFFVGKYTSAYRMTQQSVSSEGLRVLLSRLYFIYRGLSVSPDLKSVQKQRLRALAPVAVDGCLLGSERGKALGILFGENYPWRQKFIKGAVQIGLTMAPRRASRMVIERDTPRRRAARARWLSSSQSR
jgi:glycosyltransferase involved in cell wall biosynthesis